MKQNILFLVLSFIFWNICVAQSKSPEVCLNRFTCVLGKYMRGFQTNRYEAFLGIPYAKPPIGDLRFKNPVKADLWVGRLLAKTTKMDCIQSNDLELIPKIVGAEDCLYLNVYRPLLPAKNLPVMFYIHGGGFFSGSASPDFEGPEYFMDTNEVILVVPAYRVGPFGFLSTGDAEMSGNFGLKDQNLALKWVQAHISAFGGDPTRVTIFGHGTGAASAHFHMLSSTSNGLFQNAILMSGAATAPYAKPLANPKMQVIDLAVAAGIKEAKKLSSANLVKAFQNVNPTKILKAVETLKSWNVYPVVNFRPSVEISNSPDSFLTSETFSSLTQNPYSISVPWIIGNVPSNGEGIALALRLASNKRLQKQFNRNFNEMLRTVLDLPGNILSDDVIHSLVSKYMGGVPNLNDHTINGFLELLGDAHFIYPTYKTIKTSLSASNSDDDTDSSSKNDSDDSSAYEADNSSESDSNNSSDDNSEDSSSSVSDDSSSDSDDSSSSNSEDSSSSNSDDSSSSNSRDSSSSSSDDSSSSSSEDSSLSSSEDSSSSSSENSSESSSEDSSESDSKDSSSSDSEELPNTTTQISQAPGQSTTGAPELPTTTDSEDSTTDGAEISTTNAPGQSTTGSLELPTTTDEENSTTEAPTASTNNAPGQSTTASPDFATTTDSENSTTKEPEASSTNAPGQYITGSPDLLTTTDSENSTTEEPDASSTNKASTTDNTDLSTTTDLEYSSTVAFGESTTGTTEDSTTKSVDDSDAQVRTYVSEDIDNNVTNLVGVIKFNYRGPYSYAKAYSGNYNNIRPVHGDDSLFLLESRSIAPFGYLKRSAEAALVKRYVGLYVEFAKTGKVKLFENIGPCTKDALEKGECNYLSIVTANEPFQIENNWNIERMQLWDDIYG